MNLGMKIDLKTTFGKYSYAWITLALFSLSLAGHWLFGWYAFVEEQRSHNQPIEFSNYLIEIFRDTLENWQSEFLQLVWQVAGLSYFYYLGSTQSREGNDRMEEKLDLILKSVDTENAENEIKKLERKYPKA